MKKIILLLLITTSLFSQQRDLPVLDLSRDIIGELPVNNRLFDLNASKPCIIVKWNVVMDVNVQSAQNRIDNVLATVDSVVEFYKVQNYQLIPTINYLTYDMDTAVFNSYGGTTYNVFSNFFPFRNTWGSNFDATSLVFSHGVNDYAGLANTTSMCSHVNNMSVIVYQSTPWILKSVLAHELGHNLGLPHIDQAILDVMNPSLRGESQYLFSQGSLDNLEYYREEYKDCLDTCSSLPLFTDDISSFSVDNICDSPIITKIQLADPYEEIESSHYTINNDKLELIVVTKSGKVFTKSKEVRFNDCFVLYPNPTLNEFQIRTSKPIDKVQVFDLFGNEVLEWITQGFYLVKIKSKNNIIIKSLVIK